MLYVKIKLDKKLLPEKPKQINVIMEESFLVSIEGDSSIRQTKSVPIMDTEQSGLLHIEVETKYKYYEIQLLNTDGTISQKVRNVKKYTFKNLAAQEYKILMYADINNNGTWDCQNVYTRRVQEPTFYYMSEGKYTFPVRSTWEVGPFKLKF